MEYFDDVAAVSDPYDGAHPVIQAFIFDVDGVLVDSDQCHFRALRETLAPLGVRITEEDYQAVCVGRNTEHNLSYFLERDGMEECLEVLVRQKRHLYYQLIQHEATAMEGVSTALESVRSGGFKLAVASSGHRHGVEMVLNRLQLGSAFEAVVCADMVNELKPSPDIYLVASEMLGVAPGTCVAVEDSTPGLRSARCAGMKVLMVRHRFNCDEVFDEADWVLESLTELNSSFLRERVDCIP